MGINFYHIRAKSLAVLNPLRHVDEHIMDDADLAGPLLFVFCFGTFLLFVRRVFECLCLCAFILTLTRDMSSASLGSPSLDTSTASASSAHYPSIPSSISCQKRASTPTVLSPSSATVSSPWLLSELSVSSLRSSKSSSPHDVRHIDHPSTVYRSGTVGYMLSTLSILWCTYAASGIFTAVLRMSDQRFLLAYPIGLLYGCFALLSVFNAGVGSGSAK